MPDRFFLIKIRGRLGNQLFQMAFAQSLGRRVNAVVIFDLDDNFCWDTFFRAPSFFRLFHRLTSFLMKKLLLRKDYYQPLIFPNGSLTDVKSISPSQRVIQGYFQSAFYFPDVSKEDALFRIRPRLMKSFYAKYGQMLNDPETVHVHIRRSDYANVRKRELGAAEITLPAEYFNHCLSRIDTNKRSRVIVLSDDVDWVKENIVWATEFIHNENLIFDFLLMAHARVLIISNSTFAWWAAHLNGVAEAIYAPKYFLGYNAQVEYPAGIMVGTRFDWVHHQS